MSFLFSSIYFREVNKMKIFVDLVKNNFGSDKT
nr:MAG TPA: hypothetical protein [Ackermannviridae sp.]